MKNDQYCEPHKFFGITISSTFTDLEEHREALIKSIKAHGLTDVAMENDSAKNMDVIDSSLEMVRKGAGYIGVISKKYGQIPKSSKKNPNNLSITELEFNEALRLGRPILLFIMGKEHLVREEDIETNAAKKKKLKAFTERAKKIDSDSDVHRVYATFDSLDQFKEEIGPSVAHLSRYLDEHTTNTIINDPEIIVVRIPDPIPKPPSIYFKPKYIGSHKFVGRQAELDALNDWANSANPYSILLFEAMGGSGKSMLTWEWTTKQAQNVRKDWAGIFWYSFYEKGAVMADFCQHALAYMTGQPLEALRKIKTAALTDLLISELNRQPWLIILDGLERVLESYNRIRFAEDIPTGKTDADGSDEKKDPCLCINDEDDELLIKLSTASPSKILASSRLVPRKLLNASGQPIPGVQRILLSGLRPTDAVAMFRECNIKGSAEAIQNYLTANCGCHPLTIGVLAGLINDYFPARGNFDKWIIDPEGGGQLNFANLDLVQKQNHILGAAMNRLSEKSRQLLSIMTLMYDAIDYDTLKELNPHIPSSPVEIFEPQKPESGWDWYYISEEEKLKRQDLYETNFKQWKTYLKEMEKWSTSSEYINAPNELKKTVRDLEQRGLIQYDHQTNRYDLHPVVRGVASGGLQVEETEKYGQSVVDYFSSKPHDPYEKSETLEDVSNGLHIVRTLLRMGHYQEAYDSFAGDLFLALYFNLEANNEILTLIRPFFPVGWTTLPPMLAETDGLNLANDAALALHEIGEQREALAFYELGILSNIKNSSLHGLQVRLGNVAASLNSWAAEKRMLDFALSLSEFDDNDKALFTNRIAMFSFLSRIGQWTSAEQMWSLLDPMGRDWSRIQYRLGDAELEYAFYRFYKRDLNQEILDNALRLAKEGNNRSTIRYLFNLQGRWQIEKDAWQASLDSFSEAVRLARTASISDARSETWLAVAKTHLGQLSEPIREAERLSNFKKPAHRPLAELWLAIGNKEKAVKHALEAYKEAWADGEPYVHRYELNKAIELLNRLQVEIPQLPPYDPAKDEKFPWEEKVEAFIEKIKTEKEKKDKGIK